MFDYNEIYNTKCLFSKLINKISIKNHQLHKFNLIRFFDILKRLEMENEWEPSYEYIKQSTGGWPIVYAINRSGEKDSLYNRVITDGTIEGFIQLAFLYILHDKFCLYWHALYNKTEIITSIKDLSCLPFDERTLIDIAKHIEIQAKINLNFITINICTFNNWKGLQKIPFLFDIEYPHKPKIINNEVETIIKYDCGICY